MVERPIAAFRVAISVSELFPVPGDETDFGKNVAVTPGGTLSAASVTFDRNPLSATVDTVTATDPPRAIET